MLRRSVAKRQVVSSWEFGQPQMATGFGKVYTNKPDSTHIVDSGVKRSTLSNGITVITHDKGLAQATVGVFADAGAKYDPATAPGASGLLRFALLTSNVANSTFQIDRSFRSVGAAFGHAEAQKRWVGAWAHMSRASWRIAVENFAPAIAQPRFAQSELERYRDYIDNTREEQRWNAPRDYAIDELEQVAFAKEPLGMPRMPLPTTNDKVTTDVLLAKYATYMQPSRVRVVGVNVPHQDLVAEYESFAQYQMSADAPHFKRAAPALPAAEEAAQYYGGRTGYEIENRAAAMGTKPDMDAEGIVAIGWLINAGAGETAAKYASGLVYKEMCAMQAAEALQNPSRIAPAYGTNAFYRAYTSAGLVGFTVRAPQADVVPQVQAALKSLPSDYAGMLGAAKARAAVTFADTVLASESDYAAFLASSNFTAEELLGAINATTATSVADVAEKTRTSAPSMFATGSVADLPSLRQLGF